MDYDILDYGAIPDGKTKCTVAIQTAIDECTKSGGRVIIPVGTFLSGTLRLRSNVELYLARGAVLLSSLDPEDAIDYFKDSSEGEDVDGWEGGCFLFALHEKNIAITGTGTIDGQGRKVFFDDDPEDAEHECPLNVKGFRPRMSYLEDVENLLVSDVTFFDSAFWTLHMAGCRNVRIENIVIDNNKRGPNNDGIDPDCCQNVIIRDCRIKSGDDCIVLKATAPMAKKYAECKGIVVSGCILSSSCTAIKIGTETFGDIHDVTVSDCTVRDSIRGIGIWSRDGGEIYNIDVHHVRGNTRNFADSRTRFEGVCTWWGEGEPIFISATQRQEGGRIPGMIRDITMDHICITGEAPIVIAGEEYSPIGTVSITSSEFSFKNQSGKTQILLDERPSARGRRAMNAEKSPDGNSWPKGMKEVYLRNADHVTIDAAFTIDESFIDAFSPSTNIRPATTSDLARIAEIQIFNYRLYFYPIFQSDEYYFAELQVPALMQKYEGSLDGTYVYDDGVVKGFIKVEDTYIARLFVEPVLQNAAIGSALLEFAVREHNADHLWALEKNVKAISFYERHGFALTGDKKLEEGTSEYLVLMKRKV
ncbi:MAG: GNAT family N-acetyltransferase [Lachnospiraceae bacterium]|nr:GNAT family N-acetyltransferase [Lachnospiraceae bacterium]